MWATALGEILAAIGLAIYSKWAADQAVRGDERGKMALAASVLAQRALAYKADAAGRPGGVADLRVKENARTIALPSDKA